MFSWWNGDVLCTPLKLSQASPQVLLTSAPLAIGGGLLGVIEQ